MQCEAEKPARYSGWAFPALDRQASRVRCSDEAIFVLTEAEDEGGRSIRLCEFCCAIFNGGGLHSLRRAVITNLAEPVASEAVVTTLEDVKMAGFVDEAGKRVAALLQWHAADREGRRTALLHTLQQTFPYVHDVHLDRDVEQGSAGLQVGWCLTVYITPGVDDQVDASLLWRVALDVAEAVGWHPTRVSTTLWRVPATLGKPV